MNAEFTKRRQEYEYNPDFYVWHENRTIRDAISILLHYSRPDEPLSAAHPGARLPLAHPDAHKCRFLRSGFAGRTNCAAQQQKDQPI